MRRESQKTGSGRDVKSVFALHSSQNGAGTNVTRHEHSCTRNRMRSFFFRRGRRRDGRASAAGSSPSLRLPLAGTTPLGGQPGAAVFRV